MNSIRTVYLAGSYLERIQLRDLAQMWMSAGFTVTSNWLIWEPEDETPSYKDIDMLDRSGIESSDLLAIYPHRDFPSTKGGMHFELGYALGIRYSRLVKDVPRIMCICGHNFFKDADHPNPFYANPCIEHMPNTYTAVCRAKEYNRD